MDLLLWLAGFGVVVLSAVGLPNRARAEDTRILC